MSADHEGYFGVKMAKIVIFIIFDAHGGPRLRRVKIVNRKHKGPKIIYAARAFGSRTISAYPGH